MERESVYRKKYPMIEEDLIVIIMSLRITPKVQTARANSNPNLVQLPNPGSCSLYIIAKNMCSKDGSQ
jgi:hypothetical protein